MLLDGPDRAAELTRDCLLREVGQVSQHNDLSLSTWQCDERTLKFQSVYDLGLNRRTDLIDCPPMPTPRRPFVAQAVDREMGTDLGRPS